MTSSQETERVYSYNPGVRTGQPNWSEVASFCANVERFEILARKVLVWKSFSYYIIDMGQYMAIGPSHTVPVLLV